MKQYLELCKTILEKGIKKKIEQGQVQYPILGIRCVLT